MRRKYNKTHPRAPLRTDECCAARDAAAAAGVFDEITPGAVSPRPRGVDAPPALFYLTYRRARPTVFIRAAPSVSSHFPA